MKKQSFNFKDIKGVLTREEMRSLNGGTGPVTCVSCKLYPNLVACCIAENPYCPQNCYAGVGNSVCWQCTPD